jgi:glycosyltransferase involved in cell wall biosynthesis
VVVRALGDEQGAGPCVALVLATSTGGVGRHVAAVARGLAATGHHVAVFGPAATEERFGFSSCGGDHPVRFCAVEIGTTPNPVAAVRAAARLRRLTRSADVLHAHGLRAAGVAAVAHGRWRRPRHGRWRRSRVGPRRGPAIVMTLHNAMLGSRLRRAAAGFAMRRVAAVADVVLAVSPDLVDQVRPAAPSASQALVAAPLREPGRDRLAVRRLLGIDSDCRVALAVGRLHPQKGFDVLVESAARLRDAHHRVCVLIAGDGPARPALGAAIRRAGVDVRLLGDRHDVADLLRAADVVAMPSRWEGWPLAAGEVLAAGVPLVASRVGGLPALVGDAAVLVPPGDPAALAVARARVLDDPSHAADLAAAGRRRAAELPTDDDVTAQLVRCYAAVRDRR